jgi:hypothetical protein
MDSIASRVASHCDANTSWNAPRDKRKLEQLAHVQTATLKSITLSIVVSWRCPTIVLSNDHLFTRGSILRLEIIEIRKHR